MKAFKMLIASHKPTNLKETYVFIMTGMFVMYNGLKWFQMLLGVIGEALA